MVPPNFQDDNWNVKSNIAREKLRLRQNETGKKTLYRKIRVATVSQLKNLKTFEDSCFEKDINLSEKSYYKNIINSFNLYSFALIAIICGADGSLLKHYYLNVDLQVHGNDATNNKNIGEGN